MNDLVMLMLQDRLMNDLTMLLLLLLQDQLMYELAMLLLLQDRLVNAHRAMWK